MRAGLARITVNTVQYGDGSDSEATLSGHTNHFLKEDDILLR
jgi:hypothetical protein